MNCMSDYYGCESLGFYFAKLDDVLFVWTQSIPIVSFVISPGIEMEDGRILA